MSTITYMVVIHHLQGVAKNIPKIACHFLNNRLEF